MTPAVHVGPLPWHRAIVRFLDLDGPENDGRLSFAKCMTVAIFVGGLCKLDSGYLLTLLIFVLSAAHGRSVLLRALSQWKGFTGSTVSDVRQHMTAVIEQIKQRRAATGGEFEETRAP